MTRKPKPKKSKPETKGRNVERQALRMKVIELGGRVSMLTPELQAPKVNNTLKLPARVTVPDLPKMGSKFECGFRTYKFIGTRLERIGAVRKRHIALWGTPHSKPQNKAPVIISLPIEGGQILESVITSQFERLTGQDIPPLNQDAEAALIWSDRLGHSSQKPHHKTSAQYV